MKLKRLFVLAGVVALVGMLWASPAAADGHLPTITLDPASVPAEAGDVTLTITGANWPEPSPFFITACPGAAGDPDAALALSSAPEAIAMCPNLMASALAVEWDDGSFTTEWTTAITQADIDAGGLVILAGWLSVDTLSDPEQYATVAVLGIGADEEAAAAEAEAAAAEAERQRQRLRLRRQRLRLRRQRLRLRRQRLRLRRQRQRQRLRLRRRRQPRSRWTTWAMRSCP